ncbi:DUF4430 domain-containing protein [Virgibacillus byunsanensis]|uniref:DUF4430 domain-containing protein n=1 Tax=Virgibacillus byunsanensis TaxID=570945 RepID=A0ABW3LQ94_9BACI
MNKMFFKLTALLLVFGLLMGCASDDTSSSEENEGSVDITISKDNGEEIVTEKEVPIEDGAILMDVMQENFDIEEDEGFITSIEGEAPEEGEQKAWMFFVNDEMGAVGANELELQVDDRVTFDLQAWE